MTSKEKHIHLSVFVIMAFVLTIGLYVKNNYTIFSSRVTSIEITLNNDISSKALPIMYVAGEHEDNIDFKRVYRFKKIKDSTYATALDDTLKVRRLRLYLNNPQQTLKLYDIDVRSADESKFMDLDDINVFEHLTFKKKGGIYKIEVRETNSFIELPQQIAYTSDFKALYQYILPLLLLMILAFFVLKAIGIMEIELNSFSKIAVMILILSVFCPAPVYNIALILAAFASMKELWNLKLKNHKLSLIMIAFFVIYLLNNIFVSSDSYHDMSTIDRLLPLLVLAIVIPAIGEKKALVFFPVSALILGFGFLSTSIVDALIYKNEVFLSFDFFTKYLHPVYFSYLLFFSICYVDLDLKGIKKYFIIAVLFVFLVFSGSKMVFIFTLLAIFINIVRHNRTGLLIIPLLFIIVIFSPLKHRFNDVLNIDDASILKEKHIQNKYDTRINGMTLRFMLWREALATMNGFDYVIGKGVTDTDENELIKRLIDLGLVKHSNYNPHSQYVDTFWRTGILGLISLFLIPFFSLFYGIKTKNKLLIFFSIFMTTVMITESVFGRVTGVYFFTLVLLLLTSKPHYEDSHIRN